MHVHVSSAVDIIHLMMNVAVAIMIEVRVIAARCHFNAMVRVHVRVCMYVFVHVCVHILVCVCVSIIYGCHSSNDQK